MARGYATFGGEASVHGHDQHSASKFFVFPCRNLVAVYRSNKQAVCLSS
jgi:hypothetical protein